MKSRPALVVAVLLSLAGPIAFAASGSSEGDVPVPGAVLHYAVLGEGEPLLLRAGGPGRSPNYMQPIAAGLGTTYRYVFLDQRGTGKTKQDACWTRPP